MSSEDIVTSPAPQQGRPFEPGNPGRKPGSRNKSTLLAQGLLKDDGPAIMSKAIEMAKAGNVPMLKLLVDRMLPKQRTIEVELSELQLGSDSADAVAALFHAVATGQISPSEGAAAATLLEAHARTQNFAELEKRMERIEQILEKSA
jgi:hypothetical protein